jgi:CRP/FNR family transcriptional regulator, cyclic AMP receptor protein
MGKALKSSFDPKVILAKVGAGKTILEFHKNQNIYAQGDVADTVFYLQKGRVKLTVLSEQGKEAVVAILEPGQFFGEGCLNGHPLRIRDHVGDGRMPDHLDNEGGDDCSPS